MTPSNVEFLVALSFLPALAATGLYDLRRMLIPNRLSLIGLALFAGYLPLLGWDQWSLRAGVALIAFAVCFGLFAVGWLGGGDAKILPVTFLFVPVPIVPLYLFAFSFSMIVGMVGIWMARQRFSHPDSEWVSMQPGAAFPMGISIALSLPLTLLLTQLV